MQKIRFYDGEFDFNRFVTRLAVAMSQAGLSTPELARRANLSPCTIRRIMRRESREMFVTTLAKLAFVLGVSPDYLMQVRGTITTREREIEEEVEHCLLQRRRRKSCTGGARRCYAKGGRVSVQTQVHVS